jgi:uncharacterized iron-regulated membrane protein
VPLRRALLKIHLWLALAVGLYVIVISVSGSLVIFRPELNRWAIPRVVPSAEGERLQGDALAAGLETFYADYEVVRFAEGRFPRQPVEVLLLRDGVEQGRLFDPYAIADMGESYPRIVRAMEWLVSLHDDLLVYGIGRKINGIGGGILLAIALTGMILWWPGQRAWFRSLFVPLRSARPLWHIHSAVGFWTCVLLLNWSITSLYLSFPDPFEAVRDGLDPDLTDFVRPGDTFIPFVLDAHFGRFGGWWGRITWAVLGLAPAVLFITGFLIWWRGRKRGASS